MGWQFLGGGTGRENLNKTWSSVELQLEFAGIAERGEPGGESSWNFLRVPLSLWLRTDLCCEIPQDRRTAGKGGEAPGMLPGERCSELTQGHWGTGVPSCPECIELPERMARSVELQ